MNERGLICVSVMANDGASLLAAVSPVAALIDVVEVRLDSTSDHHIVDSIASLPVPVLVTNRPVWEGGRFTGNEDARIDLLCNALQAGARYVDIELLTAPKQQKRILQEAKKYSARVIISSHNFQTTPESAVLASIVDKMIASGADIGKIVTTATSPGDTLRILAIQEMAMTSRFPLSAFAMGAAGTISRLATLYLGGFMTYVALSKEQATAPGQITVQDMHTVRSLLEPAR